MLKKYFLLNPKNEIEFLGEFENFNEAWDFANYELDKPFIYIYKIDNLINLQKQISQVLSI
jgi:hypothetical protein